MATQTNCLQAGHRRRPSASIPAKTEGNQDTPTATGTPTLQALPPPPTTIATAKYADWKKGDWCWLLSSATQRPTIHTKPPIISTTTTVTTNNNNNNRHNNNRHANTIVAAINDEDDHSSSAVPSSSTPKIMAQKKEEHRKGDDDDGNDNIYLAAARRCLQTKNQHHNNNNNNTGATTKKEAPTTPLSRHCRKPPPHQQQQHQQQPATTTVLKNEHVAVATTTKVDADMDTSHGNGAGGGIRTQGDAEDTVTLWRAGNWCWLVRDDEQKVHRRRPPEGTQQATQKTTTVTKKEEEGTGEEDPRKLGAREETIMSNTTAVGVVASNNIKNENGTKKKPEKTKKKKTQEPRIQDTGDTIHKIATAAAAIPIESSRRKRLASPYSTKTLTEKDQPTSRGKKRKHTSIGSDRRIRHDTPHRMPPSSTTTTSVCMPKELRTYCNESNYWSIPATTIATRTIRQTRSFSTGGGAVTPSPSSPPSSSSLQPKQRTSQHRMLKRPKKKPRKTKNTAIWKRLQIGARVGIYWKDYKCYFPCTIEHRDEAYTRNSRYLVRYDDGTSEWTVLKLEKLRWLDEDDHLNDDIENATDDDRGEEEEEEEEVNGEVHREDPDGYGNDERKVVAAVPENTSTNVRNSFNTTTIPTASTTSVDWKELVPSEESPEFPKSFVQILEMIDRFPDEVLLLKPPMYNLIMSKTINTTTVVGDNDRRYSFAEELYHHARHGARKGIKTRNRLRDRQNAEGGGDPRLAWHHSKQAWSPTKRHDVCSFVEVLIEIAVDAWIWW